MAQNSSSSSSGVGVVGLLGVAFVVLKLTGVIAWSWWWITAPFWGGTILCIVALGGVLVTMVILDRRDTKRRIEAAKSPSRLK